MLKELINKFYSKKQEERDRQHFYITDVGKCPKAIFFTFKKYPKKEIEARVLRIFDHGNYVHQRIMSVLFSLGIVRASEIEIPKQEMINGRADAIISLDSELYVVDIKSINKIKFNKLEEPNPEDFKQVLLYLHFFKIPKGILLYECKDTQEIKEFFVEYDEELANKLLENFKTLKDQIDKNQIPEKPKDLEDWRCQYCVYADECKKIG